MYSKEYNMEYSTDPNPNKLKSKCLYFRGNVTYPTPVKFNGHDLPWVSSADHMGHTFHQSCYMDKYIHFKHAKYFKKMAVVDVRKSLCVYMGPS